MKTKTRNLFSLIPTDTEYFNNKQKKIELVSCLQKEMKCKEFLVVINKTYLESEQYRRDMDFQRSIEKLKDTFYKTTELIDFSCMKCSALFRSTIIDTLKNIKSELEEMRTGLFGNKRYQSSYILVDSVLLELEKSLHRGNINPKKTKVNFIESRLKKSVG